MTTTIETPHHPILLYCTGRSLEPRPGAPLGYAFRIEVEQEGVVGGEVHLMREDPRNSPAVACYLALIAGLESLLRMGWQRGYVVAKTENQMIVRQMRLEWQVGEGEYTPYAYECAELMKGFTYLKFWWITPSENQQLHQEISRKEAAL